MEYYFIGIKGTGMASLACILYDLGHQISGSDLQKHFFTEDSLVERNIPIYPFSEDNIHSHMNIIIGNAFLDDFPEVRKAKADPTNHCWRYHEFLGLLMENYTSFGVAGCVAFATISGIFSVIPDVDFSTDKYPSFSSFKRNLNTFVCSHIHLPANDRTDTLQVFLSSANMYISRNASDLPNTLFSFHHFVSNSRFGILINPFLAI